MEVMITTCLYILGAALGLFIVLETIRRKIFVSSAKPLVTCVIDAILYLPYLMRLGPFGKPNDINAAIAAAIENTSLSDFGSDNDGDFVKRYTISRSIGLHRSMAKFSPTGYIMALSTLQKRMETRLRLVQYLKDHPEVRELKFHSPPVFTVGFPRTGTTFLHELLGLHPSVKMHYTWEQMDPVPFTNDTNAEALRIDRLKRYEKNKLRMQIMLYLSGDEIQSIHRVGYDESEECTTPLSSDLPWNIPEIAFIAYAAAEVNELGAGSAFKNYKEYLQLLQFQSPERNTSPFTWMLKCPFHLPYLNELYDAFPGSTVVWTHRDPVECIASACSLYETLLFFIMENSTVDRAAMGRAVLNYTKLALTSALETLAKLEGKVKCIHVRYADTIKMPKDECKKIVKEAGLEYSEAYDAKLDAYITKSNEKRSKLKGSVKTSSGEAGKALHTYSLEDYGLTKELVRSTFKDYVERFNLAENLSAAR